VCLPRRPVLRAACRVFTLLLINLHGCGTSSCTAVGSCDYSFMSISVRICGHCAIGVEVSKACKLVACVCCVVDASAGADHPFRGIQLLVCV
jgi:hypothetical protein